MTGAVSIAENSELPLVLSLVDGAETLYPQVVLLNDSGVVINTVDLTHQANGVYINAGTPEVMPANPWVSATYIVYKDAGHLSESLKYQRVTDIFTLTAASVDLTADVAAIKAKTDQLNFTVPDHVDVNMRYHNDQKEYGTGTPGDKWRGYP